MKYRLITFLSVAVQKVLQSNVEKIRMGKTFTFECDGRKTDLPEKIAKEIANPVMEDYTIEKL